jgi:hypothetical protein
VKNDRLFTRRFRSLLIARPLLLVALAIAPCPALASVRLGFGADYWFDRAAEFNFTLGLLGTLTREVSAGVRFGALVVTGPATAGIPLDLQLRVALSKLYLEGSAGPWILFTDRPVRAHAAFGFGLQTRTVSFGIELGWLDPAALLGLRLGLRI